MKKTKRLQKRIITIILAFVVMADFFCVGTDQYLANVASLAIQSPDEDVINEVSLSDEVGDFVEEEDIPVSVREMMKTTYSYLEGGNGIVLDGDILSAAASTDGDWFAIGCGRGNKKDAYASYLKALDSYVTSQYAKNDYGLHRVKATEWHRIGLAVLACGGDPTSIGKDQNGKPVNLVKDGVYECKVGNPWKQGINGAIYALILLDAGDYEVPEGATYNRQVLIDYILGKELSGGGFALSGTSADVDVTAMALQALAPYKDQDDVKAAINRGLKVLSKLQKEDGDFASYGTVNSESTAQVLIALCALKIDPMTDERFITNSGNTLIDGIEKYYVKNGGFAHTIDGGKKEVNGMATQQSLLALIAYSRYQKGMTRLYDFTDVLKDDEEDPIITTEDATEETTEVTTEETTEEVTEATTEEPDDDKQPEKKKGKKKKQYTKRRKKKTEGDLTIERDDAYLTIDELSKIAGIDKNLQLKTKTKEGKNLSITFHGEDLSVDEINQLEDALDLSLSNHTENEDYIKSLADQPEILSFTKKGDFPAECYVEVEVDLADGMYLLFLYNEGEMKAEAIKKVEVKDGIARFTIDRGGDYFLAVRAKAGSLKDEVIAETYVDETVEEGMTQEVTEEEVGNEPEKKQRLWWLILPCTGGLLAVIALLKKKNMKKMMCLVLCLLMAYTLVGCHGASASDINANVTTAEASSEDSTEELTQTSSEETEEEYIDVADFDGNEDENLSKYDMREGQDEYYTDPVPEGKPQPVEPEDATIDESTTLTCTLYIECKTILNNMDDLTPSKTSIVPKDGVIMKKTTVTFYEGESVFDILDRETKNQKIHMESTFTPMYNSAYVEGIGNLYEFDCGELSGWMYSVNGWFPNYGCSRYEVQDGDAICFRYTCDLGADLGEEFK